MHCAYMTSLEVMTVDHPDITERLVWCEVLLNPLAVTVTALAR